MPVLGIYYTIWFFLRQLLYRGQRNRFGTYEIFGKKIAGWNRTSPAERIYFRKSKNKFFLSFYRQNDKIILYSKKPETLNIDR